MMTNANYFRVIASGEAEATHECNCEHCEHPRSKMIKIELDQMVNAPTIEAAEKLLLQMCNDYAKHKTPWYMDEPILYKNDLTRFEVIPCSEDVRMRLIGHPTLFELPVAQAQGVMA